MLDRFLQLDGQLLVAIQGLHAAWLDPVVSFYTKMGDAGILFIALSLAIPDRSGLPGRRGRWPWGPWSWGCW